MLCVICNCVVEPNTLSCLICCSQSDSFYEKSKYLEVCTSVERDLCNCLFPSCFHNIFAFNNIDDNAFEHLFKRNVNTYPYQLLNKLQNIEDVYSDDMDHNLDVLDCKYYLDDDFLTKALEFNFFLVLFTSILEACLKTLMQYPILYFLLISISPSMAFQRLGSMKTHHILLTYLDIRSYIMIANMLEEVVWVC